MDAARNQTILGSTRSRDLVGAFLAGLAVAATAALLGAALLAMSPAGASNQALNQSADESYTRVEHIRSQFAFGAAAPDTSYDHVEALRGTLEFGGSAPDRSYDQVEAIRANPPGQ